MAARDLQAYVGTFGNDLYGQLKVTVENGKPFIHYRKLKVELTHWNGDNFSFLPNEFSKSYSGTDIGDVMFNIAKPSSKTESVIGINLLHEGADSFFYRKN